MMTVKSCKSLISTRRKRSYLVLSMKFRRANAICFAELAIQSTHTFAVSKMVWHHRDPFDRLLIAQALSLPAYLLMADSILSKYTELGLVTELT
jgi:PIN domain nuclease of toxin-antitoxin system